MLPLDVIRKYYPALSDTDIYFSTLLRNYAAFLWRKLDEYVNDLSWKNKED